MNIETEKKLFLGLAHHQHVLNILSFVVTLCCAIFFNWQTKDLIWGLWASSFSVGYTYIVVMAILMVVDAKGATKIIMVLPAVFSIGFFTLHFGGFHLGHAFFLMDFFPIDATPSSEMIAFLSRYITYSDDSTKTLMFVYHIIYVFKTSWIMILFSFVSRWNDFKTINSENASMMKPYLNVVRMHILIFVFAGLSAAHLNHIMIYPVLAFYFFPWGALFFHRKKPEAAK
jgi:hypothetical protein